jgi:hypothetical protein
VTDYRRDVEDLVQTVNAILRRDGFHELLLPR